MSRPGRSRERQRERERARRVLADLPVGYAAEEVARRVGLKRDGSLTLAMRGGHLVSVGWSESYTAAELDQALRPMTKDLEAQRELEQLRDYAADNDWCDLVAQELQQRGVSIIARGLSFAGAIDPDRPEADS